MHGYHGRYLRIDVTTGRSNWIELPPEILRRYIGGVGLAAWILHHEAPTGVDPLEPAAPLIFCFSPLVGTPLTTSAKFAVVAKSPLTNRCNDALSSSHFAIAGKKTGADAIVIVGACTEPSILVVEDGVPRIEPASDLWGLSASVTSDRLTTRLGPAFQSAVIGPAGENRVRFATISHHRRHAGRGGMGAVMGAKNLKAIAVAGNQLVDVADSDAVVAAARDLSRRSFGPATAKYRELGTLGNLLTFNRLNVLPTRNFRQGTFDDAPNLADLTATRKMARESCAACTIGCEHIYAAPDGAPVRLEYESLFALGPLCGIGDRDAVLRAARLCDDLGLDTISAGATIAFAMECCQRGLLADSDLRFGNHERQATLLRQIAFRQGLGDLLAEGSRLAAATIGGDAPEFAPHVKGLEIPGYEPRTLQTMALGFAVGTRGADHNRSGAYEVDFSALANRLEGTEDAAWLAVETEDRAALIDSLILCKFLRGVFENLFDESADLLHKVTGWNVTGDELQVTAQRIVTVKKMFNIREGWTRAEDTLPRRFLAEGLPAGLAPGGSLPAERLRTMVGTYYIARGWTSDGLIPRAEIERLDTAILF
jgi:aldehyde:ferredoxin oxidoreductase